MSVEIGFQSWQEKRCGLDFGNGEDRSRDGKTPREKWRQAEGDELGGSSSNPNQK